MKKPASHQLDVAIIGGGVAGAYCGWRLTSDKPKLKTALFEYGQRIGGRLFSATLPGAKHVPCELGGMRIIKGEQQSELASQLQGALNSRQVIEQAKGVLMGTQGISARAAYEQLRSRARAERRKLPVVCAEVVQGAVRLPLIGPDVVC